MRNYLESIAGYRYCLIYQEMKYKLMIVYSLGTNYFKIFVDKIAETYIIIQTIYSSVRIKHHRY